MDDREYGAPGTYPDFVDSQIQERFGFVITDPDNFAVAAHRRPTQQEQEQINYYRERYKRIFREAPAGIHVVPGYGALTVFLPNE